MCLFVCLCVCLCEKISSWGVVSPCASTCVCNLNSSVTSLSKLRRICVDFLCVYVRVLQCVNMLQSVCCSVLRCVAVCHIVLQCIYMMLQFVEKDSHWFSVCTCTYVYCNVSMFCSIRVLQCVAGCRSVVDGVAVCSITLQCVAKDSS